jgi:anti-anti-sigma factor
MSIPGCEVHVSVDADDGVVLRVVGELDLATAPTLEGAFNSLSSFGARRVVLDVSELSFISAAGVRVALTAQRRLASQGNQFLLRGVQPLLLRVLHATDLQHEFQIEAPALRD